ncbi:unnamed protein product (macronuclear) [Paramecium tetraurelia]|uniref:Protein kinase domain-containing protein n=1 Tax=Paramecium tetraurelia TaxID=5888 RepID=A0CT66_PARTE|nr:uncharacterized protein GSPATT00010217001 [Paramecium tetraurelia]CAK73983.1 unnamed protein product [Paramecium tetraurelia]|eukprot:XP_001441380.1 hypothetical protein (macronuclear) [Paramecium tetraurelia strain d4-2]
MEINQLISISQDEQNGFFSDDDEQISQIIEQDPTGRFCKYNEEIGKGAYKSVFRGYDNQSGCEVAWNVFQLHTVPENERRRARQEISILSSLKHNNIINFIHSWHNKKKKEIIFITEIINGGSLKNYLRRILRPKLKVIKNWCRQILLGLEFMHKQNIIHRDLKCENILIDTNNNELKIGDLGLSIQLQSSFTSSVLGTPEFMAPEIYQEHYDTKVDIYAFGMCLLEMVTGAKPFCECKGGIGQVIKKVMEQQKPQSIDAILNDKIKSIILECLKPPEQRPSVSELLLTHFNGQTQENDNLPVAINEQYLIQLRDDSKNSSLLKCNLSNKILLTAGSSKFETNSEISNQKQPQQIQMKKKNIIIQTDEETDQVFMQCYKAYIDKKKDDTFLDLEQRQEKELQILKQFHAQQKQEYLKKTQSFQAGNKISNQLFQNSGFMSPRSYQNFFDFQNESNTIKSIVESPCMEKIANTKISKQGQLNGDSSQGLQFQINPQSQNGILNQLTVDKQIEVNF